MSQYVAVEPSRNDHTGGSAPAYLGRLVVYRVLAPSGIGKMLRRRVVCRDVTCGILLTHRDGSAPGLRPAARTCERGRQCYVAEKAP
jgi:hypothetical protein